jgi:putative membrane protein
MKFANSTLTANRGDHPSSTIKAGKAQMFVPVGDSYEVSRISKIRYRQFRIFSCIKKANRMNHNYWSDWYFGWGWVLCFGFIFLIFSSFGNWAYTYRAHRKYDEQPEKRALDILNERYARGEITREQYTQLKSDISAALK